MRHLFRNFVLYQSEFVPILFELRNLKLSPTDSLLRALQVGLYVPGFTEDHFKFGLEHGAFVLLLDGLDELRSKNVSNTPQRFLISLIAIQTSRLFFRPDRTISIERGRRSGAAK